jgi:uncharacterized membrane protein
VIGSGFLVAALALIVIYTSPSAFFSPVALVVVAAIGLAAVLLQLRFRRDVAQTLHLPTWLNFAGIVLALVSLFSDFLRLSTGVFQVTALTAVLCFSISSVIILDAIRKHRVISK